MTASELVWREQIQLLGYELQETAVSLRLTSFWQTTQPLSTSLKLFVHLLDPTTGELIAQSDGIPRQWTYPTNVWEPGEVVRDEVELSVADVATGTFELWIGWYDPETGARLPVTDGGEVIATDAARLAIVTHNR